MQPAAKGLASQQVVTGGGTGMPVCGLRDKIEKYL
jgi:hypothetical protein